MMVPMVDPGHDVREQDEVGEQALLVVKSSKFTETDGGGHRRDE
jgi:hypothetical protein